MFQISNDWSSILRRPPMGLSSPLYQPRVLFCEHCSNLTRKIWNPIQYFGRLDSLATSWLGPLWTGDTWKVYWGCATEHGAAWPGSTAALGPWLCIMTDINSFKTHDLAGTWQLWWVWWDIMVLDKTIHGPLMGNDQRRNTNLYFITTLPLDVINDQNVYPWPDQAGSGSYVTRGWPHCFHCSHWGANIPTGPHHHRVTCYSCIVVVTTDTTSGWAFCEEDVQKI